MHMGVLGDTGLWGVSLRVMRSDGSSVDVPCLVDTGAPVTVLNIAAAEALGLRQSVPPVEEKKEEKVGGEGGKCG